MSRTWGAGCAIVLLLVCWQCTSEVFPDVLVPSPRQTFTALIELARTGELFTTAISTIVRAAAASVIAIVVGIGAGWAASSSSALSGVIAVIRGIGVGIPPVVVAVLAMLWWGADGRVAVAVAALVLFPVVASAAQSAFVHAPRELIDMGKAFNLPRFTVFRTITTRLVSAEIGAASRVVASSSLRVVLMTEVIAVGSGIGARIAYSRSLLLTDEVFAWAVFAVGFALAIDRLLVNRPARRAKTNIGRNE
ncbi:MULTISPECIES: ABC transporter permease [Brevibacterium]|uniref:ABC transporter permease n=1 Tax=Brevibacterium TaxID=1696 RepID=UPI0014369635|nr:ABC transporter permease subunit [Brevibacterium aurantiacum]